MFTITRDILFNNVDITTTFIWPSCCQQ